MSYVENRIRLSRVILPYRSQFMASMLTRWQKRARSALNNAAWAYRQRVLNITYTNTMPTPERTMHRCRSHMCETLP